jgi:hypothetical protein
MGMVAHTCDPSTGEDEAFISYKLPSGEAWQDPRFKASWVT